LVHLVEVSHVHEEDAAPNDKQRMLALPEVQQCYYVTGTADFMLVVLTSSMEAYEAFTKRALLGDGNVRSFTTHVVCRSIPEVVEDLARAPRRPVLEIPVRAVIPLHREQVDPRLQGALRHRDERLAEGGGEGGRVDVIVKAGARAAGLGVMDREAHERHLVVKEDADGDVGEDDDGAIVAHADARSGSSMNLPPRARAAAWPYARKERRSTAGLGAAAE
jgi:hypothetical protein